MRVHDAVESWSRATISVCTQEMSIIVEIGKKPQLCNRTALYLTHEDGEFLGARCEGCVWSWPNRRKLLW